MSHCYLCHAQEDACGHNFGPSRKRELERRIAQYQRDRHGVPTGPSRRPRDTGPIDLSSYIPIGVDPSRRGGSW